MADYENKYAEKMVTGDSQAKEKKPSKTGETILSLLSTLGSIAGNVMFGQDIGIGQPFALGANFMKNKREEKSLIQLLNGNPHTKPVIDMIGQATAEAGGQPLINHPVAQQVLSGAPNSQAPISDPSNAGQAIVGQPDASQSIDYTSPEFLQRMALLRPDLAEKVTLSRAIDKSNPLMEALGLVAKQQQIAGWESPEDKRAARTEERMMILEAADKLQRGRQREGEQARKHIKDISFTAKEDESYNSLDQGISNAEMVMDKIAGGFEPTLMKGLFSENKYLGAVAQRLGVYNAEEAATLKELTKNVFAQVKAQSGVQYGMKELVKIEASAPNTFDTKESLVKSITEAHRVLMWQKYQQLYSKMLKSGSQEPFLQKGISVDQMRAFNELNKKLKAQYQNKTIQATSIFTDPSNAPLLSAMGIR